MRLNPVTVNARDDVALLSVHHRDDQRRGNAVLMRSARIQQTRDERDARRRGDVASRRSARARETPEDSAARRRGDAGRRAA